MKLGGRELKTILGAAAQPRHYRALANMARGTPAPMGFLARYLSGKGRYPRSVALHTPLGTVAPMLFSHHDLLTVSEIFFRQDYPAPPDLRVVVDIGSNIGLSALYFLSRGPAVRCFLFEPVPRNVERLRRNLGGFEARYALATCAVGDASGEASFGVEPTGRYGGLGLSLAEVIRVPCRHINEVLAEVLAAEGAIDLLKIDTEGAELATLQAIAPEHLARIGRIYVESAPGVEVPLPGFELAQVGPICQLTNRATYRRPARAAR